MGNNIEDRQRSSLRVLGGFIVLRIWCAYPAGAEEQDHRDYGAESLHICAYDTTPCPRRTLVTDGPALIKKLPQQFLSVPCDCWRWFGRNQKKITPHDKELKRKDSSSGGISEGIASTNQTVVSCTAYIDANVIDFYYADSPSPTSLSVPVPVHPSCIFLQRLQVDPRFARNEEPSSMSPALCELLCYCSSAGVYMRMYSSIE